MTEKQLIEENHKNRLASFHGTMAEQLNSRLSESPRFFALILAALTAYAYVISQPQTGRFLLALVSLISYVVLLWAIWYVAALGYAFRFLQYSMHQAEKVLGWDKHGLSSGEVSREGIFSSFWLLPGIYHAHLSGLVCIVGIVCFIFGVKWWNTAGFWCPHWEAVALGISTWQLGVGWSFFINKYYRDKYDKKLNNSTTCPENYHG